jgi:hypothetical protein
VSVALVLALLSGGCAAHDNGASGKATPRPSAALDGPALTVDGGDGATGLCLHHVRAPEDLTVFDDFLVASTPLTITGVRAVGVGDVLETPDGLAVPVVGRRPLGSGVVSWPVRKAPLRSLAKHLEWTSRTPLVGAHLDVQRAVMAFVHLRGGSGARLDGIDFDYRTDAGATGTVRSAKSIRFSRRGCG